MPPRLPNYDSVAVSAVIGSADEVSSKSGRVALMTALRSALGMAAAGTKYHDAGSN